MRVSVATEGPFYDGRVIAPDALTWPDEKVPVTLSDDLDLIVGYAKDFQREGNQITAELSVQILDEGNYSPNIAKLKWDQDDENLLVAGEIRQIIFTKEK